MIAQMIAQAGSTPIIAPLRNAAAQAVNTCLQQLGGSASFHIIEPLSYLQFGYLTTHAQGIITDSGNVAEEATFNGVPCITLNSYTEHIETVKQGTNLLVGEDAEALAAAVKDMVGGQWKASSLPDRWDGRTADRIVSILLDYSSHSLSV